MCIVLSYLVFILSSSSSVKIAKILFYQSEIQAVPVATTKPEVSKPEVDMAKIIIDSMTSAFDPAIYHDEYQVKLRQAIERKIAGKEIVNVDNESPNNIIDLMEAMKKTVEMAKGNKGLA